MYDLNNLVDPSDLLNGVLLLTQAHDINARGQIVGCAYPESHQFTPPASAVAWWEGTARQRFYRTGALILSARCAADWR
jgi:hypothetical protein